MAELRLSAWALAQQYATSAELKEWARQNKDKKYVPPPEKVSRAHGLLHGQQKVERAPLSGYWKLDV